MPHRERAWEAKQGDDPCDSLQKQLSAPWRLHLWLQRPPARKPTRFRLIRRLWWWNRAIHVCAYQSFVRLSASGTNTNGGGTGSRIMIVTAKCATICGANGNASANGKPIWTVVTGT